MGGPRRTYLLALASALFLVACGGGDDGTDTSSPASATSAGESARTPAGITPSPAGNEDGSDEEGGSDGSPSGSKKPEQQQRNRDPDLPERGEVSSNSAPFEQYSAPGKLHLAEFGEEAGTSDLEAVQDVVVPYLNAVAADEWSTACNYLLTATKSQLEDLPNQSGGCATALREAAATFARQSASATAPEGLASLRIETGGLAGEGAGFALFHASNGEDMWVAVKKQRGEWGVLSTSAQPFQ